MDERLPIAAILILIEDEETVIDFLAFSDAVPSDLLTRPVASGRVTAAEMRRPAARPRGRGCGG